MKISRGSAALAAVFILVCAGVAWEWHAYVRTGPEAVRQLVAPSPTPSVKPSAGAAPVTYVPRAAASTGPSSASAAPRAQGKASPGAVPPVVASTSTLPEATAAPYEASGTAAVTEPPLVSATLAPHVIAAKPIAEPPDAPPRILAMSLSTPVARGGELVSGTVETSTNVASVEARIAGYSSPMQKIGAGKFVLSYRVPRLPFFLHRTYMIEVIARNTRGDAVRSAVPITIR